MDVFGHSDCGAYSFYLTKCWKKVCRERSKTTIMSNQDMTTFQAQLISVAVAQRQRLSLVNEALRVRVTTDTLLW